MYEQFTRDYQKVALSARDALDGAALLGRLGEDGKCREVRVRSNENAPHIPRGALVTLQPAAAGRVHPGTFVMVKRAGDLVIRRLVRTVVGPRGMLIHVAPEDGPAEGPLPAACIVGRIVQVRIGERTWDPNLQSVTDSVRNFLTEYGTCSPARKLVRMMSVVLPSRFRPHD